MKKTKSIINSLIIGMIIGLFSLSLVSASLDINPQSISFNAYPGESIEKNITITTDGTYAVNLSYTIIGNQSPININLTYDAPIIVNLTKKVPIIFTFPVDTQPQVFRIYLKASMEQNVIEESISSGGGGGGILYKYWNGSNWTVIKPNAVNETTQQINQTIPAILNNTAENNETVINPPIQEKIGFWQSIWNKILSFFKWLLK